ncbi:MAG: pyridoxal 5'-phosphate synthase [Acidobacteriota bacterium]|nr:pyridoxal 5'-phosphate synthase [Acidobacteriota bacterium]
MPTPFTNPPPTPWPALNQWLQEAAEAGIRYPHAATLSTVDSSCEESPRPDARIVLIHEHGPEGLLFSTDDQSPKAQQLQHNPEAAVVFYWGATERQVRVRGRVVLGSEEESDRCFEERPRESRVTAWASRQGAGLASREELEKAWEAAAGRFAGVEMVPRPAHWRAYRLVAREVEFWQAAARRLHHRGLYRRVAGSAVGEDLWEWELLWP